MGQSEGLEEEGARALGGDMGGRWVLVLTGDTGDVGPHPVCG